ncbi:hypothetical protein [Streptomyces sp. NPDC020742]|uniref:hypothetical protein n=1 Tax=unclassified Streptomyces TaxID=2593676 RepID=UPI0033CC444D
MPTGSAAAADGGAERLGVTLARHLQALQVHDGHLTTPPSGGVEWMIAVVTYQVP